MSALIIAIYLWLGGMFGTDTFTPNLVYEYQIEAQHQQDNQQNTGEWPMIGS